MQAGDLDAELADKRHVVFDDDDRLVAVDLLEQLSGLQRLGIGHAGDGLVNEEQLRLLCQEHADFEPLLLAMRQASGHARSHAFEPGRIEDVINSALLRGTVLPQQRGSYAPVILECQHQIVLDRMHVEDRRLLKLAADAKFGDLGFVKFGKIVATLREVDVAGVRPGLACDDIHHRGFAGAVRTDDRAHLARLDDE